MPTTDVLPDTRVNDRETWLRPARSHPQNRWARKNGLWAREIRGLQGCEPDERDRFSPPGSRLASAAVVLTVVYGSLFISNVVSWASDLTDVWLLMGAQFAFASIVMILLYRPLSLSPPRVRSLETALFGGLTALVVASQYTVNLALMRRGDLVGVVSFVAKDGVIQTFALMVLYGTFIPNNPKTVAKVVAGMVSAPVLAVALLGLRPEVAHLLRGIPRASSTTARTPCSWCSAAGMAIYGCVSSTACGPSCTRPGSSASTGSSGRSAPAGWARSTWPSTSS